MWFCLAQVIQNFNGRESYTGETVFCLHVQPWKLHTKHTYKRPGHFARHFGTLYLYMADGRWFFSAAEHPLSSKSTGFRSEVQFILWILKKAWSMTTKCLQNERLPSSGGEQKKSMVIYHNMCEQTSSGKMINIYFQCILKRTPGLLCLITVLWIRDT